MGDKEIIAYILDSNFRVILTGDGPLVIDKLFKKRLNLREFAQIGFKMIGPYVCEDGSSSLDEIHSWCNGVIDSILFDLNELFSQCSVGLSFGVWNMLKPDGSKLFPDSLYGIFAGKYSSEVIDYYYNEWLIKITDGSFK